MKESTRNQLIEWAEKYNDPEYFREDPVMFPRKFAEDMTEGRAVLQDVEIAAIFAAHFAWGRRSMIIRDCTRLMDEMEWRPFDYVQAGEWRDDETSIHRTTKWSDVARICKRLKEWYFWHPSLEVPASSVLHLPLTMPGYPGTFRVQVEGWTASGKVVRASYRFEVE